MSRYKQVAPNVWEQEASRGWVVYVENTAHYFPEDKKEEAQTFFREAKDSGVWASPPMPAHMGT